MAVPGAPQPGEFTSSKPAVHTLVLLRHGESEWNLAGRFTGWVDVDLSEQGRSEITRAARLLRSGGLSHFDVAHTSLLKRAVRTLWGVLEDLDLMWIPVRRSWRLNERMYGGLQGLSKSETAAKHGAEQVLVWRRSYAVPPPVMSAGHEHDPCSDRRYAALPPSEIPRTESLKDVVTRFRPYWVDAIAPDVRAGRRVLVAAHGNSLRALLQLLFRIPEDVIVKLNIPTAIPLVIKLDEDLQPVTRYYLADDATLAQAVGAAAALSSAAAPTSAA